MLRGLIAFCLLRRPLVLVAYVVFLGLGLVAFTALNIEAYPDPAPPIVEIIAQRAGQSPEEMERYVTIPIEIAIASTPGLRYIRSNTVYALSFIRLQFEYGRDYHFVRQQTINRLREADLPQGVQPVISPAGTISEIFRYELKGPPDMDLIELKTLQDWVVERRLRMVPGVSDVLVLGGKTKEVSGRDRPQSHARLRRIDTADHQRDRDQQRQCWRPNDRDGRAGGQCPWPRCCQVARRYRRYRADPGGRPAGTDLRCCQNADRLHTAAGHRRAR